MAFKGFNQSCCRLRNRIRSRLHRRIDEGGITPLSSTCRLGRKKICKIAGDRKLCAKMASMGMYPGKEVELICAQTDSQCLLRVHGGTISLDAVTSEKILVESI